MVRAIIFCMVLCTDLIAAKVNWSVFKTIVDENQSEYFERNDADNLSFRLRTRVLEVDYECNVMKSSPGNSDLVDYQTNYQSGAKTGG